MKKLHRHDMWCWSQFDKKRNLDFHSYLWVRTEGNVVFDPLPLTEHDQNHLDSLGGVKYVLLTNSDHIRGTQNLVLEYQASVAGPEGERDTFPIDCDRWLSGDDMPLPGLQCIEMEGSKTVGELAFLVEETTLITGDLIRSERAGRLDLLPTDMLVDPEKARDSIKNLLEFSRIDSVLVGDGWPVFNDGLKQIRNLI